MADFNQMGGLPTGYSDLLNAARQQLVKLPDGTYTIAPQFGGSSNINDLYKGIYPPAMSAPAGPTTRVIQTTPVRPNWSQGSGGLGNTWAGTASAPPVQSPVFRPPGPSQFAEMNKNDVITDIPAPQFTPAPDSTIDAANPLDMSFYGLPSRSPATAAIDDLLKGSGRPTSFPFPLPGSRRPIVPSEGPQPIIETRDQAWVEQGPDMAALDKIRKASQPGSAFRPGTGWGNNGFTYSWMNKDAQPPAAPVAPPSAVPQVPGSITFKRGDTVGKLAKSLGMTVSSFADRYGIANPNKIFAGQTVTPQAPVMPRMSPAGLGRGPMPPVPRLPPQALNRARQIAEGKASQLDEFGMIR